MVTDIYGVRIRYDRNDKMQSSIYAALSKQIRYNGKW